MARTDITPGYKQNEQIIFGGFAFDPKLRTLNFKGEERKLSPKEAALLNMLTERVNDILPRE